jgi:hypothetical protein
MAFPTTPTHGDGRLTATADNQRIDALAGNDRITSIFNASTLYGGLGHDRITVRLDLPAASTADFARTAALFGGGGMTGW